MKIREKLLLMPIFSFLLIACQPGYQNLKIIVTTDVHGSFFPNDISSGAEKPVSLARVQSLVGEERNKKDQEVILLDNGDILQGDPLVYYFNFEKTDVPHICSRIMNFMQYDAAAMGNHDIETGHPVYDKVVGESNFPWLAANAVRTDNGEPYFQPYSIINRKGTRIAVLGLITPAIPSWLPPSIWSGMSFEDMIKSAAYWIEYIKENEKPDLIAGLFHSGMDYNYNGQNEATPKNENAVKLVAEQVSGFDIIFCGHDHKTWNEKVYGPGGEEVIILGSRSKAFEVAVADISLIKNRGRWEIETIIGINKPVGKYEPDKAYMDMFTEAEAEVKQYVIQPLGTMSTTITSKDAFFGPSAFIDLIHTVQLDISGAEISFAAPLSFDTEIRAGEILVGDMFDLYRYENLLYTIELSGREITDYLNFSYGGWFNTMNSTSDHFIQLSSDESGRFRTKRAFYNFDSAMGIKYEVDVTRPAGEMVKVLAMANGDEFYPDRKYLVAVNSYRGNGGGGHLVQGAGISPDKLQERLVRSTTKDLRYHMMKWVEEKKEIHPLPAGQWKVVPESFAIAGRETDYPIMFRN